MILTLVLQINFGKKNVFNIWNYILLDKKC